MPFLYAPQKSFCRYHVDKNSSQSAFLYQPRQTHVFLELVKNIVKRLFLYAANNEVNNQAFFYSIVPF